MAYNIFEFKNRKTNTKETMTVHWNGKTNLIPSSSTVYLQAFNRTTNQWETIDSYNSTNLDIDFDLQGELPMPGYAISDYLDSNNWTSCRVYQEI